MHQVLSHSSIVSRPYSKASGEANKPPTLSVHTELWISCIVQRLFIDFKLRPLSKHKHVAKLVSGLGKGPTGYKHLGFIT